MFPGYTKEGFLRVHNYVYTHSFGYPEEMPTTLCVPLADMINCLPTDTSYDVYCKSTTSSFIPNPNNHPKKRRINSSSVFVKEFREGLLDTHSQDVVKGDSASKRKATRVPRES